MKDSAYTDEKTNSKEGKSYIQRLIHFNSTLLMHNNIGIDFGDGFQLTSELDPYDTDSDELTED